MSSAERAAASLALALTLAGCAIQLDDGATAADGDDNVTTLPSCAVLAAGDVVGVRGRLRVLPAPGGGELVVADALQRRATAPLKLDDAVYVAVPQDSGEACGEPLASDAGAAVPGLDLSALSTDDGGFLATFTADGAVYAFVETSSGFTALGTGLARWDAARGVFVAGPRYLFAAGRPSYGEAALTHDGFVYAYGCASAGFLRDDCYVARAPLDALDDPTAWTYYRDGDAFESDPDDAWPLFSGGRGLAARRLADGRVLVAYATPLGDTVFVRTGLGPAGPWSPAVAVTRCALPIGAFCGAMSFVPALDGAAGEPALTYAIASFDGLAPADLLTRLVRLPLP
ncbi:MAG: DUF4185 domain-containing protein [Deltaproteobacteria bacterium]|nr:MAG: DUF4185 domain-containing protein [Deltaproteobacteria bacterium]